MTPHEARKLLDLPFEELISLANKIRERHLKTRVDVCSIINAKSGRCSEDCKFCAQSAHYNTHVQEYPLKSKDEMIEAARVAKKNGAQKFGIVTSGRCVGEAEIEIIAGAINQIREKLDMIPCASLGSLCEDSLRRLKDAGLSMYHHNIETSERFYPRIVSTHSYEERLKTIRHAKTLGLEVCSGGILGLGETWQDRIDMAFLLEDLKVDSVPLNFLVPIKGTPLEGENKITPLDAMRSIALFRIILKNVTIKIAAGRETLLKDYQALIFTSGANSIMIGGYLTIAGRPVSEDQRLIQEVERLWNKP